MRFQHPWPDDLPACCPQCAKKFDTRWNLVVGPGRVARILRATAYGMIVPWMVLGTVLYVSLGMPNGGLSGGYGIVGTMFVPPALIGILSLLFPNSRRVTCNSCFWRKDFPISSNKTEPEIQQTAKFQI